jgi:hypothetical protein
MNKLIKKMLREALNIPKLRLGQKVDITDEEKNKIKNVNWADLNVEEIDDDGIIVNLKVTFPFETNASEGIAADIQVINGIIYQIHLNISDNLKGLGLGYKIHKKLIHEFGHLYSGHGRTLNKVEIPKIWNKLSLDPDIECASNDRGDQICVLTNHKNKEELLSFVDSSRHQ